MSLRGFCFFYVTPFPASTEFSGFKYTGFFKIRVSFSPSHSKPTSLLPLAVETEFSKIWKIMSSTERLRSLKKSHHKTQVPMPVSALRYYASNTTV